MTTIIDTVKGFYDLSLTGVFSNTVLSNVCRCVAFEVAVATFEGQLNPTSMLATTVKHVNSRLNAVTSFRRNTVGFSRLTSSAGGSGTGSSRRSHTWDS